MRHGDEFRYERARVSCASHGPVLYKSSRAAADEEALLDEVQALRALSMLNGMMLASAKADLFWLT